MKLLWSERQPNMFTGKIGQFMELVGGGTWAMGDGFDYFIEPMKSGDPITGDTRITYFLDQTLMESDGFAIVRTEHRDSVEELQVIAQEWEG